MAPVIREVESVIRARLWALFGESALALLWARHGDIGNLAVAGTASRKRWQTGRPAQQTTLPRARGRGNPPRKLIAL
jgi:hypothetical protein